MRLLTVAVACLIGTVSAEPENFDSTVEVAPAENVRFFQTVDEAEKADERNLQEEDVIAEGMENLRNLQDTEEVAEEVRNLQDSTDEVEATFSVPRHLQAGWEQLRSMIRSIDSSSAEEESAMQDNFFLGTPRSFPSVGDIASYLPQQGVAPVLPIENVASFVTQPVTSLAGTFLGIGEAAGETLGLGNSVGRNGLGISQGMPVFGPMTEVFASPFDHTPLANLQGNIGDFSNVAASVTGAGEQLSGPLSFLVDGVGTPFAMEGVATPFDSIL